MTKLDSVLDFKDLGMGSLELEMSFWKFER